MLNWQALKASKRFIPARGNTWSKSTTDPLGCSDCGILTVYKPDIMEWRVGQPQRLKHPPKD
jgi:hypothetical protein